MKSENIEYNKRDEIKDSAKRLFMHFGFNKTNMADIARQCGLTKPALYYYYNNKQALFNEILLEEASSVLTSIENKLQNMEDCANRFKRFFKELYSAMYRMAAEMPDSTDVICEYSFHGALLAEKIQNMLGEKLKPILEKGRDSGEFKFDNTEMTLRSAINMLRFLNLEWVKRTEKREAEIIINKATDFVLCGLKGDRNANGA